MTSFIFVVAWVLSIAFSGLLAAGLIVYIRRTLQLMRADEDGSAQDRILDSVDLLQAQLHAINGRLERIERRLGPGSPAPEELPPPPNDG